MDEGLEENKIRAKGQVWGSFSNREEKLMENY